jgi:hypothetical protein
MDCLLTGREDSNMSIGKTRETRVVLMSSALMKLYEVKVEGAEGAKFHPITFYDPQECLEMLTDVRTEPFEDDGWGEAPPDSKHERIEKQWGELELRLSFFTDNYKWQ